MRGQASAADQVALANNRNELAGQLAFQANTWQENLRQCSAANVFNL
jgi:hypothetical protein